MKKNCMLKIYRSNFKYYSRSFNNIVILKCLLKGKLEKLNIKAFQQFINKDPIINEVQIEKNYK